MARLITIRFSHFCEKARWALDRAGIAFEERAHLPLFAWVPALAAARNRTVPVFVSDGKCLSDSTDILRHAGGLHLDDPEVAALEDDFDRHLGPATRRIAYHALMSQPQTLNEMFRRAAPWWQVAVSKPVLPVMLGIMRRGMRIDDRGVARSREVVEQTFEKVAARISDGRRYLCGDRFTAADLTFAALSVPILVPPAAEKFILPEEHAVGGIREMLESYRATPAGTFAMRLYEER
jgi:glutathione S-transferase